MPTAKPTIEQQIKSAFDTLTPAERRLASHITRHYPVAAMGSITTLANGAKVSTPSVVRLAQKLGYKGYPDLQNTLRIELEERLISPLVKHDRWTGGAPQTHMLNRFADVVLGNLQATLAQVDHDEFDAIVALMADQSRKIFTMGGRITHSASDYFATHMKVIRPNVERVSHASSAWPPALIDLSPGDVFLAFDIRRYENNVLQVVEIAADQGAEVILITDQWVSPAATHARYRISAHIEAPSAWDSTVAIQVLVETLLAAVETLTWQETQIRLKRLEELYARARLFRRGK